MTSPERGQTPRGLTPAVFLDRDGVVNVSPGKGFITRWDNFRFLPGSLEALRLLKERRVKTLIASNQSAVGRGLMKPSRLDEITRKMLTKIEQAGGRVEAVYYCPHHPRDGCRCRKPKTGLLRQAARRFSIDLRRSFLVGDSRGDIAMGQRAGCTTLLVLSGKENKESLKELTSPADHVCANLLQATRWILRQKSKRKRGGTR